MTERKTVSQGERYGKLVVVEYINTTTGYHERWICKCDCGKSKIFYHGNLLRGLSRSCGCLAKELTGQRTRTHGLSKKVPEYAIWASMRDRCSNPNDPAWKNYGGRGIFVCEQWMDFSSFYKDMGSRPSRLHTLERVNNDGNYCKENCIWADRKTQNRNSRNNRPITYNGETKCIAEWAEILNIPYSALWDRLCQYNWPIERAFSEPIRRW